MKLTITKTAKMILGCVCLSPFVYFIIKIISIALPEFSIAVGLVISICSGIWLIMSAISD